MPFFVQIMLALSVGNLSNVYRACSFFTISDPFCIDNACVIGRKIRHLLWMMHLNNNRPVTVFTWMQYDFNRRWHLQKRICQGKMYLSNLRWPPKNKMSAKTYCTINFTHSIHKTCQILPTFTNQYNSLHLHSQCLRLPHTHSYHSYPLHCHSTTYHQSHPLHWVYSTFEYPSRLLRWDALFCYYDPRSLTTKFMFLGLYPYLNPWRLTVISKDGVSGVQNLNTCVWDFCVMFVVWSV